MAEPRDKPSFARRRQTFTGALVAIVVALALGALFNAQAMRKTAQELPFGRERDMRLRLVDPVASLSDHLYLDRPASFGLRAIGRPDPRDVTAVAAAATPRPTPSASPAETKRPEPEEKPLRRPYPGHPLHLYIAGDSILGIPGMALADLSNKTRLIRPRLDYRVSTGLARPDFFDWPARLERQVRDFDPGAVVVMWGANDNQGIQTPGGKVYQFGSRGWQDEYRRRVDDVIALLFGLGVRRIYWAGQPPMPDDAFDREMRLVNDVYREAAARHPGVWYIDTYDVLSDDGAYAQYLKDDKGRTQQVREADGEHLTYAGGLRLAEVIMAAIKAEWLARPQPKRAATTEASDF